MPFKSEKQRRYLWAEHPEIAKRWAKKYPNKQKLPLYINDDKQNSKTAIAAAPGIVKWQIQKFVPLSTNTNKFAAFSFPIRTEKRVKNEITAQRDLPVTAHRPTCSSNIAEKTAMPADTKTIVNDESAAKTLLSKIAVVLSPRILKEIEERKAKEEARKAQYIPQNVNLRQYPPASSAAIPPPIGMATPQPQPQQSAAPPQQQAQRSMAPVGGGSNPMANPINAFGALSMAGNINGNAAFGAKNSPDSSKVAAAIMKWAAASPTTPCSCGCGDTVATCKCSADCKCRKPGGSCYKAEKKAGSPAWQRSEGKNDEGGLNAKGRASYNRATGGNLKAPVTESNPKGKRAKRQNSFCSRMCGMKRVNTGSKTKKDPDSRINKALRKWNCKCGNEKTAGGLSRFVQTLTRKALPIVPKNSPLMGQSAIAARTARTAARAPGITQAVQSPLRMAIAKLPQNYQRPARIASNVASGGAVAGGAYGAYRGAQTAGGDMATAAAKKIGITDQQTLQEINRRAQAQTFPIVYRATMPSWLGGDNTLMGKSLASGLQSAIYHNLKPQIFLPAASPTVASAITQPVALSAAGSVLPSRPSAAQMLANIPPQVLAELGLNVTRSVTNKQVISPIAEKLRYIFDPAVQAKQRQLQAMTSFGR